MNLYQIRKLPEKAKGPIQESDLRLSLIKVSGSLKKGNLKAFMLDYVVVLNNLNGD